MSGTGPDDNIDTQNQQHLMLVIAVILAISKDTARGKGQLKPGEVFPSWQASISPVTQTLRQQNP